MNLRITGAGHIGQALARQALRVGYPAAVASSRGPDTRASVTPGRAPGAGMQQTPRPSSAESSRPGDGGDSPSCPVPGRPGARWDGRLWAALAVLCCVLFLDGIDVSMVTVALPSIRAEPP